MKKGVCTLIAITNVFFVNLIHAGEMGPQYTWTGFTLGATAGYGWGNNDARLHIPTDPGSVAFFQPFVSAGAISSNIRYDQKGFIGGVQLGHNRQVKSMIYGIEMDINGANIHDSADGLTNTETGFPMFSSNAGSTLNWLVDFRGRIGFTVTPKALIYATAGVAIGGSFHTYKSEMASTNDVFLSRKTDNNTGYVAGAGGEWLLHSNWSIKAEYLYYNLGHATDGTIPEGRFIRMVAQGLIKPISNVFSDTGNAVRLGLIYHLR